jgi:hypothetical protein
VYVASRSVSAMQPAVDPSKSPSAVTIRTRFVSHVPRLRFLKSAWSPILLPGPVGHLMMRLAPVALCSTSAPANNYASC